MMRVTPILALLALACSGSPSKPAAVTPTSEPPPSEAAPVARPADRPPEADVKPDTPAGAAAQRDAELATKAAGFIDVFSNDEPVLTHDGKRVVFGSDRDGLPQLYIADATKPDAPATRLVKTTEQQLAPVLLPDGKSLLFMSDTGQDELYSYFRVGLDGTGMVDLTPGEKLDRDPPIVSEGMPDTMVFTARKMSEARSTVYTASVVTPGPAKPIYSSDHPTSLSDVDRAGKRALVIERRSRSENYVDLIDLGTAKPTRLFPADGKASTRGASFSPDGKTVYLATDGGGEQALVLALDASTGKELARHAVTPATALITGVTVAPRSGVVALTLLLGNRSEVRLLDGRKLTQKVVVKMPLGRGDAGRFSRDGKRLTAIWSTPSSPQDIYSVDVATGAAAPLRREPRPTLTALPRIETSVVDIPAFDGGRIPTNVHVPAGEQTRRHPVIVSYHGGPAGVSPLRWNVANVFFVSLGYVVVEPNVRGSAGFGRAFEAADNGPKRLDAFKDVETSARWAAAQPWADKDRMVVYGASYGGYLVLIALSRWPDIWRAGVDMYGAADLNKFMAITTGSIRQTFLVEFGDPDKDAAFLASISPSTDIAKIADPTFVYAGANDPFVPRSESDLVTKALRQRKVPSEYMVAEGEGHSLSRRDNQLAFYSRCARFLEAHLK